MQSQARRVLTNVIVEVLRVKLLMHNVALDLKPLLILLRGGSGGPAQHNPQLASTEAAEQKPSFLPTLRGVDPSLGRVVLELLLLLS